MTIIEKLSLDQLADIMGACGYPVKIREKIDQEELRSRYLVEFRAYGVQSFLYFDEKAGGDPISNISLFVLDALFEPNHNLTADDINDLNHNPIRGRFAISDIDYISYKQEISLTGGVTRQHIENEIHIWADTVHRCLDYLGLVDKSAGEISATLDKIAKRK